MGQISGAAWVGRYGGDEFVLVLPETSAKGTHQLAERICNGVSRRVFDLRGGALRLTVSGGVGGYPEAGIVTPEDLIDHADRALYQAKAAGRNQILLYKSGNNASEYGEELSEVDAADPDR